MRDYITPSRAEPSRAERGAQLMVHQNVFYYSFSAVERNEVNSKRKTGPEHQILLFIQQLELFCSVELAEFTANCSSI